MSTLALIAQDPAPAQAKQQAAEVPFYLNPLFLMGMMVLFFFVVMWPAQRRAKREQQNMLSNLKPGAKVVTSAGIVGKILTAKDGEDEIMVQSGDSKLRVLRSAVVRVTNEETTETK